MVIFILNSIIKLKRKNGQHKIKTDNITNDKLETIKFKLNWLNPSTKATAIKYLN